VAMDKQLTAMDKQLMSHMQSAERNDELRVPSWRQRSVGSPRKISRTRRASIEQSKS
jgi:hypothetical protein